MTAALFKWSKEQSKTTSLCVKESHIERLERLTEIEQQSLVAAGSTAKITKGEVLDKILDEFFNKKSVKAALAANVNVQGQDTGSVEGQDLQAVNTKPAKFKGKKPTKGQAETSAEGQEAYAAETGYGQPNQ